MDMPVAIPGLRGHVQDVSAWLTTPGLVLLSRVFFSPLLAFAYTVSVKGLLPFALGPSRCCLLLPATRSCGKGSARAALGEASPAVEGGDASLRLSTGEVTRVLCLILGCPV